MGPLCGAHRVPRLPCPAMQRGRREAGRGARVTNGRQNSRLPACLLAFTPPVGCLAVEQEAVAEQAQQAHSQHSRCSVRILP